MSTTSVTEEFELLDEIENANQRAIQEKIHFGHVSIETKYRQALAYYNHKDYFNSYNILKELVSNPSFTYSGEDTKVKYYTLLFKSAYEVKKYEGIIEYGKIALNEENPEYLEVMRILRDLSEGHRFSKSIKSTFHVIDYCQKLIEAKYDVDNSYKSLARAYYKLNRYDDMYEASLHIKDEEERKYYQIIYDSAVGNYEQAIELADSYLSDCPTERVVTILLTYISNYIRLHDEETAKYIYESIVEHDSSLRNSKLESFFDYYFSKDEDYRPNTYIQRQLKQYDPQHTINLLVNKPSNDDEFNLFSDKHKAYEYVYKAQEIIKNAKPYTMLLADEYVYHEPALQDEEKYPTDEMVVLTLPNTKKIISMHPLGISQDKGKNKRRNK